MTFIPVLVLFFTLEWGVRAEREHSQVPLGLLTLSPDAGPDADRGRSG